MNRIFTHPFALFALCVGVLLTVVFADLPGSAIYIQVLQNSAHAPAFAVLAWSITMLLRKRQHREVAEPAMRPIRLLILAFVITVALGIASEITQGFLHRDAELEDVLSDGVGALFALSAIWLVSMWRIRAIRFKLIPIGLCIVMFGIWMQPLLRCAISYWHRNAEFPTLADFSSPQDLYFVAANDINVIQKVEAPASLRVALDAGRWPGLAFNEPMRNWRGYHTLVIEWSNPTAAPLALTLRINDAIHTGEYDDRFNRTLHVVRGAQVTRIPLTEIEFAPRGRRMRMDEITAIILFRSYSAPADAVWVRKLRLE